MGRCADDGDMGTVLFLIFILLIGPLAVLYGADSRPLERRSRRWL
jgi:hypothetical protein